MVKERQKEETNRDREGKEKTRENDREQSRWSWERVSRWMRGRGRAHD